LEVQKSLDQLCTKNRDQITEQFSKYIGYYKIAIDLNNRLKSEKVDYERSILISQIQENDSDWMVLGFKNEVRELLWPLAVAIDDSSGCLKQKIQ